LTVIANYRRDGSVKVQSSATQEIVL